MRIRPRPLLAIAAVGLLLAGCDSAVEQEAPSVVEQPTAEAPAPPQPEPQKAAEATPPQPLPRRNLYWGDTHLHTSYSPDAFLMQNRTADPDTAYRFAKGLPVVHPYHRARIQIGTPLDFLVVSDHAEFMGVVPKILQGDPLVTGTPTGKRYQEMAAAGREIEVFGELIAQVNGVVPVNPDLNSPEVSRTVWGEIMDAADRHDDPGSFTAFMGWEWSSTPNGANLHRVIVMREGRETGDRFIPYSSLDSDKPEDLWNWLETTSQATGAHLLAIPHNSNISQGLMFPLQDSFGNALTTDYAEQRMRWEPIVEMTQIKGDSETHPQLSPTDEFADYETYDHLIAVEGAESQFVFSDGFLGELTPEQREYLESNIERVAKVGDYARGALIRGLVVEAAIGANPYKFGMIGSTDSHTAMSSAEENNFHGKMALDSTPESKSVDVIPGTPGWDMGAAGLVGVWAEENTRASLFDAMQRKEVYATTGPRIQVHFFGGWDFEQGDELEADVARIGYQKGVPMGGDLSAAPEGAAPSFLVTALKDPVDANLDRVQIVKGWVNDEGLPNEKVFDVAWSDGRTPAADGGLPPVGNTVDIQTGRYANSIGDAQLVAVWKDPEFDSSKGAFYYARVIQIPTPRHTLFDAIALGIDPAETGNPPTIQERAYTSPIWLTP
jgi:hypothetical protein